MKVIPLTSRILIALGGNAIKRANEKGTFEEQMQNVRRTCREILKILKNCDRHDRVTITHGNGPQAGNLMIQQEEGKRLVPPQPLDAVGAMTQGQIGWMLQQTLQNMLRETGGQIAKMPVLTVITQVLVDRNDPEFKGENASKPVGPFYTKQEALQLKEEKKYIVKKVKPTGDKTWRRVVPSPDPKAIIEKDAINVLIDSGVLVIASGGGGIPVIEEGGKLKGVEGVIDKDLAGERLAEAVNANIFLILTDVEKVKLNFGKTDEKSIDRMTADEARKYLKEGHFLAGSMGPKVEACIRFINWGGDKAIITSLDKADLALKGQTGTIICR